MVLFCCLVFSWMKFFCCVRIPSGATSCWMTSLAIFKEIDSTLELISVRVCSSVFSLCVEGVIVVFAHIVDFHHVIFDRRENKVLGDSTYGRCGALSACQCGGFGYGGACGVHGCIFVVFHGKLWEFGEVKGVFEGLDWNSGFPGIVGNHGRCIGYCKV
jgi:hypothetical protein